MNAKTYIKQLLSMERYSFSSVSIAENTNGTPSSLKAELARLVDKKEIVNLRKGFYLILPPRYSTSGKIPLPLYANMLFQSLERRYYIGLFSAAKIHGAAHQQPQRDYIVIERPMLAPIKKRAYDIAFFPAAHWPEDNILTKNSDAGPYQLSSPALTLFDLVHHHPRIGGINRVLPSLEELIETTEESDVERLLTWYSNKTAIQRTGFMLEEVFGASGLADLLFEHINQYPFYPILLSPHQDQKPGSTNNRWKVDVNIHLESDL